ncbi:MAG TPA: hypothetical protein P5110_01450 [Candidatus Omnitrophota bacterium]|nr:hypothetical protein [Candidatus Omnitrophota bacterium]HRZ14152.1 hypothetical protein [Candidatus Omnitrophota bacterium]
MWSESSHFFTAEDMQNEFPGLFGYKKEEIPEIDRRQQRRPARRQPVYDSALTKEEIDHLLGDKV